MGGMIMWALTKHIFWSSHNPNMLPGLDFLPLDKIHKLPLNGLSKWVATCHKTMIETWFDETMIELEFKH